MTVTLGRFGAHAKLSSGANYTPSGDGISVVSALTPNYPPACENTCRICPYQGRFGAHAKLSSGPWDGKEDPTD